jgi:hypothetical protein
MTPLGLLFTVPLSSICGDVHRNHLTRHVRIEGRITRLSDEPENPLSCRRRWIRNLGVSQTSKNRPGRQRRGRAGSLPRTTCEAPHFSRNARHNNQCITGGDMAMARSGRMQASGLLRLGVKRYLADPAPIEFSPVCPPQNETPGVCQGVQNRSERCANAPVQLSKYLLPSATLCSTY